MGRFSRWLAPRRPGARGTPRLAVEALETRATPATLLTPGQPAGTAANGPASDQLLAVSGDGNYVLFASKATNLVAGETDNSGDYNLYWQDVKNGVTKLVTAQAGTLNALGFGSGTTPIALSARAVLSTDGQSVAYVSAAPAATVTGDAAVQDQLNTNDVFEWKAATGAAKLVSIRFGVDAAVGNQAGVEALDPNVSDDGSKVAYGTTLDGGQIDSAAALDDGNATYDLFVRDMTAADPTKATTAATRVPGKADLVGHFGNVDRPVGRYLSGDGRYVTYSTTVPATIITGAADQAATDDVFVRDTTDTTTAGAVLVSVAVSGDAVGNVASQSAAAPVISRDGSTVVFAATALGGSDAQRLVAGYTPNGAPADLYARVSPFSGGTTKLVSAVNGGSTAGANGAVDVPTAGGTAASYRVTANGRFVVFVSAATNLVDPTKDANGAGTDVFVRDLSAAATEVESVASTGLTGSAASAQPSISDDGRYVTFVSTSPELGSGVTDGNAAADAFLRDRTAGTTRALSTTPDGLSTGNGPTTAALVAGGGTAAVFVSQATNLTPTTLPAATANVYAATLPLPAILNSATKTVTVSGTPDGLVQTYGVGSTGNLTPVGGAVASFAGATTPPRTAVGDVNGDGVPDTILVSGSGAGSMLRVVDGATGKDLVSPTQTYESSFQGGLFVAAADLEGTGKADIILSPDVGGGARIQILSYANGALTLKANFFGIADPNFRGGARVAVGDLNGDGHPEVIVGAGFGGGPRVAVYDGKSLFSVPVGTTPPELFNDFYAFPGTDASTLRNGVFVAAGDVNGDGKADLVFGGGPGGGPRVFVLDGAALAAGNLAAAYAAPVANFFAFDSTQRGGVRVAVKDIDGDGKADVVVGSGQNTPAQVETFLAKTLPAGGSGTPPVFQTVSPFGGASLTNGVYVG